MSTRVVSSTYFPTKSLWGVAGLIYSFSGTVLLARMVNIPATTVSGRKFPESIWVVDTRITLPVPSIPVSYTHLAAGRPATSALMPACM